MDNHVFSAAAMRFVAAHIKDDPVALRLKYSGKSLDDIDIDFAITQIEARRKASTKLPAALACPDFVFPTALAAEQCTGEVLAEFHTEIAGQPGDALDMTCGLGIDAMSLCRHGWRVKTFDISAPHIAAVRHNAARLNISGLEAIHGDSVDYLCRHASADKFDLVFADPARRAADNRRTYGFSDCSPDILQAMPLIRRTAPRLIVKASPMLDVDAVTASLPGLNNLYILSVRNECKELLCDCDTRAETVKEVTVHAIDIYSDGSAIRFSFPWGNGSKYEKISAVLPQTGQILHIPNSSVMKVISRVSLTDVYPGLSKLDRDSHLYVGDYAATGFPGRIMAIEKVLSYNKKAARELSNGAFNLVCRNFPDTPSQVIKKLKIKEGGNKYLIATRTAGSICLLLCTSL